jgi:hypothetical protein
VAGHDPAGPGAAEALTACARPGAVNVFKAVGGDRVDGGPAARQPAGPASSVTYFFASGQIGRTLRSYEASHSSAHAR